MSSFRVCYDRLTDTVWGKKRGKSPGLSSIIYQAKKDSFMVQRYTMWARLGTWYHPQRAREETSPQLPFDFIRWRLMTGEDVFPPGFSLQWESNCSHKGTTGLTTIRAHPSPSAGTPPSLPANQPAVHPLTGCLSLCRPQAPLSSQSLSPLWALLNQTLPL